MDSHAQQALHEQMLRLQQGDRAAFSPIFQRLWPLFLGFCKRALPGHDDAEDVAQTALMKMFSRIDSWEPERDALSWSLGIVAYECRTQRKWRARRREDILPSAPMPGEQSNPETAAIKQELEEAARHVLGSLRPVDIETLEQIMTATRPPGATFRKRVQRAKERFVQAWSKHHAER